MPNDSPEANELDPRWFGQAHFDGPSTDLGIKTQTMDVLLEFSVLHL